MKTPTQKRAVVKPPLYSPEAKIPFVGEAVTLTKPQVISELTKSPHGDLSEYLKAGVRAAHEDPDFFAHLVAWNHLKGQVRDAKVALPVIALRSVLQIPVDSAQPVFAGTWGENALAHLADLRPREFARALQFARQIGVNQRLMRRLTERWLRDLEADGREWERTALLHRGTIKGLYARNHIKPSFSADRTLFKAEALSGRFLAVKQLKDQSVEAIAGSIRAYRLPFMVVRAALGAKIKDPDVLCAVIGAMTPSELVTNMKSLERWGVKTVPALRAALEQALQKAGEAKESKVTLKTSVAAQALEGDEQLSGKLRALQEKQLDRLGGIEGRWLVLGDASGSMQVSLEVAKGVAAMLARAVTGEVHLIFFNTSPRYFNVTGKTFEEIQAITKVVAAGGSTSIGCGVQYCLDHKIEVDGIAVVSDGGDNTSPYFSTAYPKYVAALGVEPTVYHYHVAGDSDRMAQLCQISQIDVQRFELGAKTDYYSLPNLVTTMRVGRYQLLDEVLAVPLVTLDAVLTRTTGVEVWRKGVVV